MKICAVVLNWNGKDIISDTLESLLAVDAKGHELEIVVVDNASTDGSPDLITKKVPQVTFFQNPTNMGYAAGNNRAIRYALKKGADYVWIVNSDIQLAPDSLHHFLEGAQKYPNAKIFGCKIYFAPGFEFYKDRYSSTDSGKVIWFGGGQIDWKNVLASHRAVDEVDRGQYNYDLESDFITGAVMFINTSLIKNIGGFDVKYCFYFEENDFCQRAVAAGSKLMFLSSPKAWHKNAQSTGMGSPLQDYFITRNRLLFGYRYAPMRSKIALAKEAWRMRKTGREWQKKGINDFINRRFGAGSFELK